MAFVSIDYDDTLCPLIPWQILTKISGPIAVLGITENLIHSILPMVLLRYPYLTYK